MIRPVAVLIGPPGAGKTTIAEGVAGRLALPVRDTDRDYFMSPGDAKDYGIIDAVYSVPGDSLIAQAHDAGLAGGEGSGTTTAQDVEASAGDPSEPAPKKSKET